MANHDTHIQILTKRDIDGIAELFLADMQSLRMPVSLDQMKALARGIIDELDQECAQAVCWVVKLGADPKPVGVILANKSWSLKFSGRALWIEELYVAESARRRGLGRLLVEHLLEFADAEGYHGIDLEAYQGNTPASILYRSLGFHRLGRERFYYRMGPEERF